MKKLSVFLVVLGLVTVGTLGMVLSASAEYSFTSIDFPGATWISCSAINNAGQIVGRYSDSSGVYHGFIATPDFNMNMNVDIKANGSDHCCPVNFLLLAVTY